MEIRRIRQFVHDHPEGVKIAMVNGVEYILPHRDYITFSPEEAGTGTPTRAGTSFYIWQNDELRLVNALLVSEIMPFKPRSNGHKSKPRRTKKR